MAIAGRSVVPLLMKKISIGKISTINRLMNTVLGINAMLGRL